MSSETLKLLCCTVRIGSLKILPVSDDFCIPKTLPVYVKCESLSFEIPKLKSFVKQQISEYELATVTLTKEKIKKIYGYFGTFMFILFVCCMPGETMNIVSKLGIAPSKNDFYDPESSDETKKWIAFIVDHDELKRNYDKFHSFFFKKFLKLSDITIHIISHEEANHLLVSSTASQFKVIQMNVGPMKVESSTGSAFQNETEDKNKTPFNKKLQKNLAIPNFTYTVKETADLSNKSSSLGVINSYIPSISSSGNATVHSYKPLSGAINTLDGTFPSSVTMNLCTASIPLVPNGRVNYFYDKCSFAVTNTSGLSMVSTSLITSIAPTKNNITDNSCNKNSSTERNVLSDCSTSSFVNATTNRCNSSGSWENNPLFCSPEIGSTVYNENITNFPESIEDEEFNTKGQTEKKYVNEIQMGYVETSTQQNCAGNETIQSALSIFCVAIRIGSFEVRPLNDSSHLFVLVSPNCFSFQVPQIKGCGLASITVKSSDLKRVDGSFTLSSRHMSLTATHQCAERIRSQLNMEEGDDMYYDPFAENMVQKSLTFIMDTTEELLCHKRIVTFFRRIFPGPNLFYLENDTVEKEISKENEKCKKNGSLPCLSDIRSVASSENIAESIEDEVIINIQEQNEKKYINEIQTSCTETSVEQDSELNKTIQQFPETFSVVCRAIKIGSFKVHPFDGSSHLFVYVSSNCFSFQVPKAKDSDLVSITLTSSDLKRVAGYFTLSFRLTYLKTTPECAERIRGQLGMEDGDAVYYDPDGENMSQRGLTFVMESTEELTYHKRIVTYFMETFPGSDLFSLEKNTVEHEMAEKLEKPQEKKTSLPHLSNVRSVASDENTTGIRKVLVGFTETSTRQYYVDDKIIGSSKTLSVFCTAIRIGSFEVRPFSGLSCLLVLVSSNCFFFQVLKSTGRSLASITIKSGDLKRVAGCFTLSSRHIYLTTTYQCAKRIRSQLDMKDGDDMYYNPFSKNMAQRSLTFIMDTTVNLSCHKRIVAFLKRIFPGPYLFYVEKDTVEKELSKEDGNFQEYFKKTLVPHMSGSNISSNSTSASKIRCSTSSPSSLSQNSALSALSKFVRLFCRSIIIGSYEVQPADSSSYLSVYVSNNSFAFRVPQVSRSKTLVLIILESCDITESIGHFGCCLPLISLQTNASCTNKIVCALNMKRRKMNEEGRKSYFYNPKGTDEKEKRITFMIDTSEYRTPCKLIESFLQKTTLISVEEMFSNRTSSASTSNQVSEVPAPKNNVINSAIPLTENISLPGVSKPVSEVPAPKNNVINSAIPLTENISLPGVSKPVPKLPSPKSIVINSSIPVTENILLPDVPKLDPDLLHASNSTSSDLIENTNIFVNQNSSTDVDIKLENRNTSDEVMDYVTKNIKKEELSPKEIEDEYSKTNIYSESDIQNSMLNSLLSNPTDDALKISTTDFMEMYKEICMDLKIEDDIVDNVNSTIDNSNYPLLLPEGLYNSRKDKVNDGNHNTTTNDLQSWSRKRYNMKIRKKQCEEDKILIESHQDASYSNAHCMSPILKKSTSDFEQDEVNNNGSIILPNDHNTLRNPLTKFLDIQIKEEPPDFDEYQECVNVPSFVPSVVEVKKEHHDLSSNACPTSCSIIDKTSLELNHLQKGTSNISMQLLFSESYESFGHSSHSSQVEDSESQKRSLSPVMPYDHPKKKIKSSLPESGYREHSSQEYSGSQVNTNSESQKLFMSPVMADNDSKKRKSCLSENSYNKNQSDCPFPETKANILHAESPNDRRDIDIKKHWKSAFRKRIENNKPLPFEKFLKVKILARYQIIHSATHRLRNRSTNREIHNRLEKKRRAQVKEGFKRLKKLVPNVRSPKISSLALLNEVTDYVNFLKYKDEALETQKKDLKIRQMNCLNTLKLLKKQPKINKKKLLKTISDNENTSTASALHPRVILTNLDLETIKKEKLALQDNKESSDTSSVLSNISL